jgi:hypothetical protein
MSGVWLFSKYTSSSPSCRLGPKLSATTASPWSIPSRIFYQPLSGSSLAISCIWLMRIGVLLGRYQKVAGQWKVQRAVIVINLVVYSVGTSYNMQPILHKSTWSIWSWNITSGARTGKGMCTAWGTAVHENDSPESSTSIDWVKLQNEFDMKWASRYTAARRAQSLSFSHRASQLPPFGNIRDDL